MLCLAPALAGATPAAPPLFDPKGRDVSTWRTQAAENLVLTPEDAAALRGTGPAPVVARCVKLNNYWCIKTAGWNGELAADGDGHVAFASAEAGAAVAALLLKRYYVDFGRRTAPAIISHWAPAQCGTAMVASAGGPRRVVARTLAPKGLANTMRARWLAGHSRGFVTPLAGRRAAPPRRSVVADHIEQMMPTPVIAIGLGVATRPITLDALMRDSPNAPPSRSMLGTPRQAQPGARTTGPSCADGPRIASYAAKAAAALDLGAGGDLALFAADGKPTPNLARMMANMARVEIGPLAARPELIAAGIATAFRPGRNAASRDKTSTSLR